MQRQFPVSIGVFIVGFSALGCGVSDSEIPDRSWWTKDASVSSDAGDASEGNADAAADSGGNPYGNDGGLDSGPSSSGGAGGHTGSAGAEPQAGGGGMAGDYEPAAGSGGEAAGGTGGIDAGAADAGGTGSSGGPTCPTQYAMATHIVMNVTWPATKVVVLGFSQTVVNAGSGQVHVWTKSVFDENGNTAAVVSNSCGTALPPIQTTAIAGSEKLQPVIDDAVWEKPSMPKFNGTATKNGSTILADPGVALIGLKLTDPKGAWPAVANVMGVDHDSDTHPGIAGGSKTTDGFKAIPVDIGRSKRTDRLDLATRATMTLNATVDGCPETYTGTATVTQFDNHIIGCHIEGGDECDTTQRNFVDSNRTVYKVTSATFSATRVDLEATCADVRAAAP